MIYHPYPPPPPFRTQPSTMAPRDLDDNRMISTMAPPILEDDKKTTPLAFEAFCNLGMDGGIGEDMMWLIIDDNTAKAKQKCAGDLSILGMIGTDNSKIISTFGRK